MKDLFYQLIINSPYAKRQNNRRKITRKILSVILVLALISTPAIVIIGALSDRNMARAEVMCSHEHTNECYVAPEGHICSVVLDDNGESIGCTPIYRKTTIVTSEGHTHSDDCYETIPGHTHDSSCYEIVYNTEDGTEGSVLTCDKQEQDDTQILSCTLQESEPETETVYDKDSDPIGMICRARTVLACEHKDCEIGQQCKLENNDTTPDGTTPDGATPDGMTPDGATPDGATPDGETPATDGNPDLQPPDGAPVGIEPMIGIAPMTVGMIFSDYIVNVPDFNVATGGNLTITESGKVYLLSGTINANTTISVNDGVSTVLILNNVSWTNTSGYSPLRLYGNAKVTLFLAAGSTNTFSAGAEKADPTANSATNYTSAGIYVPADATLTIEGTGTLNATGNVTGAGIGTAYMSGSTGTANRSGTIIINDGTIKATGGGGAAGIGGGAFSAGGDTTFNGGTVEANSGGSKTKADGGAGIGGGGVYTGTGVTAPAANVKTGGNITITGGTVNGYAKGGTGYSSAGIGGGSGSACGTITISGGIVNATAKGAAAGIGSAASAAGGTITVTGGFIWATGGDATMCGLGGPVTGTTPTIIITGGTLEVLTDNGSTSSKFRISNAKNSFGETLYLYPVYVTNKSDVKVTDAEISVNVATTGYTYTTNTNNSGFAYLWLPAGTHSSKVISIANKASLSTSMEVKATLEYPKATDKKPIKLTNPLDDQADPISSLSVSQPDRIMIPGTSDLTLKFTKPAGNSYKTVTAVYWFRENILSPNTTNDFKTNYDTAKAGDHGMLAQSSGNPDTYTVQIDKNGRYWVQMELLDTNYNKKTYPVIYMEVDNFYTPVNVYITELGPNNDVLTDKEPLSGNFGIPYDFDGSTILSNASKGYYTLEYYRNGTMDPPVNWHMHVPGRPFMDTDCEASSSTLTLDVQSNETADLGSTSLNKYYTVRYSKELEIAEEIDLSEKLSAPVGAGYTLSESNTLVSYKAHALAEGSKTPLSASDRKGVLTFNTDANGKIYKLLQSGVLANPADLKAPKNGTTCFYQIEIGIGVDVTLVLEGIDLSESTNVFGSILVRANAKLTLLLSDDIRYTTDAMGSYIRDSIGVHQSAKLIIGSYSEATGTGDPGNSDGTLIVTSNSKNCAAIGGYITSLNSGDVTINSGTVIASNSIANSTSAAIGGAGVNMNPFSSGYGKISINGGTVNATANGWGAAIGGGGAVGGGAGTSKDTITITGGTVNAINTLYGAAIGGGAVTGIDASGNIISAGANAYTGGCNVSITGGTVTATGNYGAGIGGGVVNADAKTGDRTISISGSANVTAYSSGVDALPGIIPGKPAIDATIAGPGSGKIINARFEAKITNKPFVYLQIYSGDTINNTLTMPGSYLCFAYYSADESVDRIWAYTLNWVPIKDVIHSEDGSKDFPTRNISEPIQPVKLGTDISMGPGSGSTVDPGNVKRYQIYAGDPAIGALKGSTDLLADAIDIYCYDESDYTIVVTRNDDEENSGNFTGGVILSDKNITITSDDPLSMPGTEGTRIIKIFGYAPTESRHFILENSKLTLENIILDGNDKAGGIRVGGLDKPGTLIMNSGAVIQNCLSPDVINVGFSSEPRRAGGGVLINSGEMTMNDGSKIIRNIASNSGSFAGFGGGVYVNGGTVNMEAGSIISDNKAAGTGANAKIAGGGGIYVGSDKQGNNATFVMNGGTISGNIAATSIGSTTPGSYFTDGGGVYTEAYGTFTMNDGEITSNVANIVGSGIGGGVFVNRGQAVFDMHGGTIEQNIAGTTHPGNGGGVGLANRATFTMYDGTISDNAASVSGDCNGKGGGIFVAGKYAGGEAGVTDSVTTFNMLGGTITRNTASKNGPGNGGGVFLCWVSTGDHGAINMSGTATINKNYAFRYAADDTSFGHGGGIFTEDSSKLASPNSAVVFRNIIIRNDDFKNNGDSIADSASVYDNVAQTTYGPPENSIDFVSFDGTLLDNDNINYQGNSPNPSKVIYISNNGKNYKYFDYADANNQNKVILKAPMDIPGFNPTFDYPVFLSWNTESNGSGTDCFPGDELKVNRNIILYAQWEQAKPGLRITNNVAGDLGDLKKAYTFWLYIHDENGNPLSESSNFEYSKIGGILKAAEKETLIMETFGNETRAQFTLRNGQGITIFDIPTDYTVRIEEEDLSPYYIISYTDSFSSVSKEDNDTGLVQMTLNRTFTFTSTRNNVPLTGVVSGNVGAMIPLLIISAALVLAIPVYKTVISRKRKAYQI